MSSRYKGMTIKITFSMMCIQKVVKQAKKLAKNEKFIGIFIRRNRSKEEWKGNDTVRRQETGHQKKQEIMTNTWRSGIIIFEMCS